jgi:hypothetical protein
VSLPDAKGETGIGRKPSAFASRVSARWFLLVGLVALLLASTSLTVGYSLDDHIHRTLLGIGEPIAGLHGGPLDLFGFASGNPADAKLLMDQGIYPWWSDPEVRLHFLRPLASLTHALDAMLWPENPVLAHGHSLLWFAASLAAAAFAFRQVAPAPLALLAFALFALDDARGPAVGWIANRGAFVVATFGFVALGLQARWLARGGRRDRWLALLAFALALLAGEAAVAVGGYLFAHALFSDPSERRRRLLALWPYFALGLIWAALYASSGWGASGSDVYLSPAHGLLPFARQLLTNMGVLLLAQIGPFFWSDFWAMVLPEHRPWYALFLLVWSAPIVWVAVRCWRRDAAVRVGLVGLLLALVPIAATMPQDRLLVNAGWGGALVAALLLCESWTMGWRAAQPSAWRRRTAQLVFVAFAVSHLLLAPPLLALRARSMTTIEGAMARADRSLPVGPGVTALRVYSLQTAFDPLMVYVPMIRASLGQPTARSMRSLYTGPGALELVRDGAASLRLSAPGGFLPTEPERMLRSLAKPFAVGDKVLLEGMTAEVLTVLSDGRPREVRFVFDRPLEDPSLRWVTWSETRFVPVAVPPIGGRLSLPAQNVVLALFGRPNEPLPTQELLP